MYVLMSLNELYEIHIISKQNCSMIFHSLFPKSHPKITAQIYDDVTIVDRRLFQ